MIDYISGNVVFINVNKNSIYMQTPCIIDVMDVQFNFLKDAVVTESFIGVLENHVNSFTGATVNKIHYIDLATKTFYVYDLGNQSVVGLFGYKDTLFVFTTTDVYFIVKNSISNKVHGFNLLGFDLVNPYTFILLDYKDVPTVSLYSIVELFRFKDDAGYNLVPSDFISVYIPTQFFDYNNLVYRNGKIYVRGKNGLSIISLDYISSYGTVMKSEFIYNTYKPLFEDELRAIGSNLLKFVRKMNNSIYVYQNEKTGRFVYEIDECFVVGETAIVFDRNYFFDVIDVKIYKYSFTSELGDWIDYNKFYCSLWYPVNGVFKQMTYNVFESGSYKFDFQVIAKLRGQERMYKFNCPIDKNDIRANIYGESFVLNYFMPNRLRMVVNNQIDGG